MNGILALPMWAAGTLAAVALVCGLVVFRRAAYEGATGVLARIALVLVGAAATWLAFVPPGRDDGAGRRALDARVTELAARAIEPGSALACLDATAGATVESACEKALFATPQATAAAVSYVTAQLALLADASERAKDDPGYASLVARLRHAAEADRYGIVAHVLAARDGCRADRCKAFALLSDSSHVSANIAEGTYDSLVERYVTAWPDAATRPVASTGSTGAITASNAAPGLPLKPPGPDVFFPSADSIPPVNIMTAEPAPSSPSAHQATTGTGTRSKPAAHKPPVPLSKPVDLNSDAARAASTPATVQ